MVTSHVTVELRGVWTHSAIIGGGSERIITENFLLRTSHASLNTIIKKIKEEEIGRACGTCRNAKFIEGFDVATQKIENSSKI